MCLEFSTERGKRFIELLQSITRQWSQYARIYSCYCKFWRIGSAVRDHVNLQTFPITNVRVTKTTRGFSSLNALFIYIIKHAILCLLQEQGAPTKPTQSSTSPLRSEHLNRGDKCNKCTLRLCYCKLYNPEFDANLQFIFCCLRIFSTHYSTCERPVAPVAQRYHVTSDTLGREFDPGKRDFSH